MMSLDAGSGCGCSDAPESARREEGSVTGRKRGETDRISNRLSSSRYGQWPSVSPRKSGLVDYAEGRQAARLSPGFCVSRVFLSVMNGPTTPTVRYKCSPFGLARARENRKESSTKMIWGLTSPESRQRWLCGLKLLQCPSHHSLPGPSGSSRLSCLGQEVRHGGGLLQSSSNDCFPELPCRAAQDRLPCHSKCAGGVCMLVLSRKIGEEIVIGDDIHITVVAVQGENVRIGVIAPKEVVVDRQEIHEKRKNSVSGDQGFPKPPKRNPSETWVMVRLVEAVVGNFHMKDTATGWQPPLRHFFIPMLIQRVGESCPRHAWQTFGRCGFRLSRLPVAVPGDCRGCRCRQEFDTPPRAATNRRP